MKLDPYLGQIGGWFRDDVKRHWAAEQKAGKKAATLCREHGISEATLYNWRSKYAGLEVSDLVKLRQVEDENRRLKKIVADQALNIEALEIVAEGNF